MGQNKDKVILKYNEDGKKSGIQLTEWNGDREYVVHQVDAQGECYQGDYFSRKYDENVKINSITCFVKRLLNRISLKGNDRTNFINDLYSKGTNTLSSFTLFEGGIIMSSILQEVTESCYIDTDDERAEQSNIYKGVLDVMLETIMKDYGKVCVDWKNEEEEVDRILTNLMEYEIVHFELFGQKYTIRCKEVDQIGVR